MGGCPDRRRTAACARQASSPSRSIVRFRRPDLASGSRDAAQVLDIIAGWSGHDRPTRVPKQHGAVAGGQRDKVARSPGRRSGQVIRPTQTRLPADFARRVAPTSRDAGRERPGESADCGS